MNINEFIENVSKIDWYAFPGPFYYRPEEVPRSLIALAHTGYVEPEIVGGYQVYPEVSGNVLNAIGNNHSGNYYPVVKAALPFVIEVALNGNNKFSREYAINILHDLYYFAPMGENDSLKSFVKNTISEKKADFIELAKTDPHNQTDLEELIENISGEERANLGLLLGG
jgi:hypothetical protein